MILIKLVYFYNHIHKKYFYNLNLKLSILFYKLKVYHGSLCQRAVLQQDHILD
jgi:hypothetical protein